MIKKLFKKITGLQALEDAKIQATAEMAAAETLAKQKLAELADAEAIAKMTPKERATAKGEVYIAVLDTHVNKDNIRNGFFELDWNDEFVVQLKQAGYGFDGDPDEEIVDRWFRDLAANMLVEEGQDPVRGAGYINVNRLGNGKAEVE
jgi:hypothetical protein